MTSNPLRLYLSPHAIVMPLIQVFIARRSFGINELAWNRRLLHAFQLLWHPCGFRQMHSSLKEPNSNDCPQGIEHPSAPAVSGDIGNNFDYSTSTF